MKKTLNETLDQIGEKELLKRLKRFMDTGQIDDDTALIKPAGKELLINTDVLVENVHFNENTACAESIGWKAIASNVSDLVASGSDEILSFTIGLVTPPLTDWHWIEGLYKGMNEALNFFGGKLIGGDFSKGQEKVISITAIGALGPLNLHRGKGKPGDILLTSGSHGLSRLGLAILNNETIKDLQKLPKSLKEEAIQVHQRPRPPIEALKSLLRCKPQGIPWRAAGTDSSDGLLDAVENICSISNCQAVLSHSDLPKHPLWPKGNKWSKWCLEGGEDFELVISLPEIWAKSFIQMSPKIREIGYLKKGLPTVIWDNGEVVKKELSSTFKHF